MKVTTAMIFAAMASRVFAAPTLEERATPRVFLIGDSTMAPGGGGSGTQGWGQYLKYSLSISVINDAVAGRSARSYTTEGRFTAVANAVASGDYVIIEFGHNDSGSPNPTDNGKSDCPGSGSQTCTTSAGVVVQTFPTYMTNAAKLMESKGAKVIISSPTPNNPWESGTFSYGASRFTTYGKAVATATGSGFVDHGQYTANIYKTLGKTTVDTYYPNDHTHTSPAGANTVAGAFVKGLLCAKLGLASYVKNSTASVQGSCI